jgi:DNA adenine methylase
MDVDSPSPSSPVDLGPRKTDDTSSTNLQHVLIKWTGSKRRQASQIVANFPRKIATYYEPFLGGGSVLYELLGTDIDVGRYEVSDACEPLIALWHVVRNDPGGLVAGYSKHWQLLRISGAAYYGEVRKEFNQTQNPYLFFFLLRTSRNGLVRFNRDGEFNSAFHGNRPGMNPRKVMALVEEWGHRLASKDVRFSVRDYREVVAQGGDLLYLDPPYKTEDGEYYFGKIEFDELFGWLLQQQGDHVFSLNGFLGDDDRRLKVPPELYDRHRLLDNGFDRLNRRTPRLVTESLYVKRRSRPLASEERPQDQSIPAKADVNSVRVVRNVTPRARLCDSGGGRAELEIRTRKIVLPAGAPDQDRLDPNDVIKTIPAMLRLVIKRLTNR